MPSCGPERASGCATRCEPPERLTWRWIPFVFHFDFVDTGSGQLVMSSERQKTIRDRYRITVPDPRLDFRVAASMAVALDALQRR